MYLAILLKQFISIDVNRFFFIYIYLSAAGKKVLGELTRWKIYNVSTPTPMIGQQGFGGKYCRHFQGKL